MNEIALMLLVTACYSFTSLSDKFAVNKAGFDRNEFTLLMCLSMSVFLAISLPFQEIYISFCWQALLAVGLVAACKLFEFQMSALVLLELTAFELKAWLGITLFASYISDVLLGAQLSIPCIICIIVTTFGLIFIARSGKAKKVDYRKIILPLALYLCSKFGYGLCIRSFSTYISPTLQLLSSMVIITLLMLPKHSLASVFKKNTNGALKVIVARIPNTIGMLAENAVIAISLSGYSFIQPMVLVSLFIIGIIRKESFTKQSLAGSLICIAGIVCFQLFR